MDRKEAENRIKHFIRGGRLAQLWESHPKTIDKARALHYGSIVSMLYQCATYADDLQVWNGVLELEQVFKGRETSFREFWGTHPELKQSEALALANAIMTLTIEVKRHLSRKSVCVEKELKNAKKAAAASLF